MPFGRPYNEAANPRAASVRAWLTAAATIVNQPFHAFKLKRRQTEN